MRFSLTAPAPSFSRRAHQVGPRSEIVAITRSRNPGALPEALRFRFPEQGVPGLASPASRRSSHDVAKRPRHRSRATGPALCGRESLGEDGPRDADGLLE